MGFTYQDAKWNWRDYLTTDEAQAIARADEAKKQWEVLNKERAGIVNRAIQRAKYANKKNCK